MTRPTVRVVRDLAWRVPLAAICALSFSLVLAGMLLALASLVVDTGGQGHPGLTAVRAVVPLLGLALATIVGLLWGVSSVAVLVRDVRRPRAPRLGAALGRSFLTLPRLLATLLVLGVGLVLSVLGWPLLTLYALGRGAWRARRAGERRLGLRGLWLAVPLAATAVILAMVPASLTEVLDRRKVYAALRLTANHSWVHRARILAGLFVLGLTSWGLGIAGSRLATRSTTDATATMQDFVLGVASSGTATLLLLIVAGTLLGLLARTATPVAPAGGWIPAPRSGRSRIMVWRPARASGVALSVSAALVVSLLSISTFSTPAQAAGPADIMVTTLLDSTNPAAGECVDVALPCGVRAALAEAASRADAGVATSVGFGVSGTVTLADTLDVRSGITLDGLSESVTLDAHGAFRAVITSMAGESEGGTATLRHLTVTGGQSETAGAGLFSDSTRVVLEQMVFSNNISGQDGGAQVNGGAVGAPNSTVVVTNSTFTNNQALSGVGGAVNAGTIRWTNSTSFQDRGVSTDPYGGAINGAYGGTILHGTVIAGGGVAGSDFNALVVQNSIIDTPNGSGAFPCARTASATDDPASGGNLDPTGTCFGLTARATPYGALGANGGPTPTIALMPGSPAIGAGLIENCTATDQRGEPRPAATACDAGAFEYGSGDVPVVNVALTAEPTQANLTETVTLKAVLTSSAAIPAGKVRFLDGTSQIGALATPDVYSHATITTTDLPQGLRSLTAEFVPDDATSPTNTSAAVSLKVRADTTLTLSSPSPTKIHDPATITATVVPGAGSDPALVPTGTVEFSAGSRTENVTITNGTAVWAVDALPAGRVAVIYSGDNAFAAGSYSQVMTTENVATATTGVLSAATAEYKAPLSLVASVRDTVGIVPGAVELFVDGASASSQRTLVNGDFTFTLDLSPGSHTLMLRSHPDAGWASSDSAAIPVTITPAASSVTLTAPTTMTYGGTLTASAQLTGSSGSATVHLLDGGTSVASDICTMPCTANFNVAGLLPGDHVLVAEIAGSATTATSRSASVTLVVAKAAPTVSVISQNPYRVSEQSNVWVSTDLPGDLGTFTLTDETGQVLDAVTASPDGLGQLFFTSSTAGARALTVTYAPTDTTRYTASSAPVSINIPRGNTSVPAGTWSANPMPGSTTLAVQFNEPVTGWVYVVDTVHGIVGSGTATNGAATVTFYGPAGECYCNNRLSIRYDGDDNWLPVNGPVADLDLPAHPTVTVLDGIPASVGRNEAFRLGATVTSATATTNLTGTIVFTIDGVDQVPLVPTSQGMVGRMYAPAYSGTLSIRARFVPDTGTLAPSTSATAQVVVSRYPTPTIEVTAPASVTIGQTLPINVRGITRPDLIVPGSTMYFTDASGRSVAHGTWTSTSWPWTSTILFTPTVAGPVDLTLHFTYGSDGEWATSTPVHVVVAAQRTLLTLTSATAAPQVGQLLELRAAVLPGSRPRDWSFPLQLNLDGVPVGFPTTLAPSQAYASFYLVPGKTGTGLYTVTTVGDGHNFGEGSAGTFVTAVGATPYTQLSAASVLAGKPLQPTITIRGSSSFHVPTGRVLVALVDSGGHKVVFCDYNLTAAPCSLNTTGLAEGAYKVWFSYDGDSYFAAAEGETRVSLYLHESQVNASFSPPLNDWLVGSTVHASWTTSVTEPGVKDNGWVRLDKDGRFLCEARALVLGCSFKVPDSGLALTAQPEQTVVTTRFTPDGFSRPSSARAWGVQTPRCLGGNYIDWTSEDPVRGLLSSKFVGDRPCTVGTVTGFAEGSTVEATFTPSAEYKVIGWLKNGVATGDAGGSLTVGLRRTRMTAVLKYAPSCVTIRLVSEAEGRYQNPGSPAYDAGKLRSLTQPNCADPYTATAEELADLAKGIGRYASGTVIDLQPHGWGRRNATVENPTYRLVDVPGAVAPTQNQYYYRYTVKGDAEVYARFRIAESLCSPVNLYAGIGGKLELVESTRPERNSHMFEDFQGRCITSTGERGFLAGSKLKLRATPTNDGSRLPPAEAGQYFVSSWLDDATLATPASRAAALIPTVQGTYPGYSDYKATDRDVTVPQAPSFRYGVGFAHISCFKVDLSLVYPWDRMDGDNRAPLHFTGPNCFPKDRGERATYSWGYSESGGSTDGGQQVARTDRTAWYLAGTVVSAWSDPTRAGLTGSRNLVWSVTDGYAPVGPVAAPITGTGTVTATNQLRFSGRYVSDSCRRANVSVKPAGFTFNTNERACAPGMILPGRVVLSANETDNLKAVWSIPRQWVPEDTAIFLRPTNIPGEVSSAYRDFVYTEDPRSQYGRRVQLDYCAFVPVGVQVVDASGAALRDNVRLPNGGYTPSGSALSALAGGGGTYLSNRPHPTDVFTDGSNCPSPLMVHPGTRAQIGLSGQGAQNYTLVGWRVDGKVVTGNPEVSVDSTGKVLNTITATITPRCQTLVADSAVRVKTAPNCPGSTADKKLYMPGTPVQLEFHGQGLDEFRGWTGVDADAGEHAVVIMNRDRNPKASFYRPSGLDVALRLVTAIEQRAIAALITAATGVAMGFLFIAQGVALIAVGIGMGLGALGVSGSALDGITNFGLAIQSGLDVVQSLSDCTTNWATGSNGLDFGTPEVAGDQGQVSQAQGVGTDVAGQLLEAAGEEGLADKLGTAGDVYGAVQLWGTNLNGYMRSPAESWGAIVDIGGCMQQSGVDAGNAALALGRS